jgi:hypothetical protein
MHLRGVPLDREVHVVPGVGGADTHLASLDVQPPLGATGPGQREVDDRALLRQLRGHGLLVHPPHQREGVAVLLLRVIEDPFRSPVADRPDDRGQRLPRRGQPVAPGAPALGRLTSDQAASLQRPQALREQGPAHPGDAAMDLVEAGGPHHQLPDDQGRPTIPEHVDPDGDRAVVRVARHGPILRACGHRR